MVRFALDSNALREPLRPAPNPRFLERFLAHRHELALPAPVLHEALFGLWRMPEGHRRDRVDAYLHEVILPAVEVLPYDRDAARWHAAERARLEAVGRPVAFADGLIAAVAARHGLVLVTHNVRDFEPYSGLVVEDWMAP